MVTIVVAVLCLMGCGSGDVQRLASITVTPASATVVQHTTQVFTAEGRDQHGQVMDIAPLWLVVGGIGTIVSNGDGTATFTGRVVGVGKVQARQFGVEGEADVEVVAAGAAQASGATAADHG